MYSSKFKCSAHSRISFMRRRCRILGIECRLTPQEFFPFFATKPDGTFLLAQIDLAKPCTVDNLKWVTPKENSELNKARFGKPQNTKLQKLEIEISGKSFIIFGQREASKFLGIDQSRVSKILNGRCYKQKDFQIRRVK